MLTLLCGIVRVVQNVFWKDFVTWKGKMYTEARQRGDIFRSEVDKCCHIRRSAPQEQYNASHPDTQTSTSSVRVTETDDIHKSLNPCNEIPHGQQRWRVRWGSFHSRTICCGLYCLALSTVPCAETACTCKSLRNGFFFFSFTPSSDFTPCPWRMCWAHRVQLFCWVALSRSSPLKCRQLPRCSPPPPCVLWNWMHLTFLKNSGWRPFISLASSASTWKTPSLIGFHCGLQEIHKQNDNLIHARSAFVSQFLWPLKLVKLVKQYYFVTTKSICCIPKMASL